MTDEQEDRTTTADGDGEDGAINDPLTRRDVEAPRAPFDTDPTPEE